MGRRWKRKPRQKKGGDSSKAWTGVERGDLLNFLQEYRDKARQLYHQEASNHDDISKSVSFDSTAAARTIGTVEFPALTKKLLSRPYLALARSISSRQRRMVHECCVEADLYHASVGPTRDDRYLVISVYRDGFDSIRDLCPPHQVALHKFRPWTCRQTDEQKQQQVLQAAQRQIEALIDQPGNSLRDEKDAILDLHRLQNASLAHIDPPVLGRPDGDDNTNDTTWELVDTPTRLRECVATLTAAKPSFLAFDLEAYNASKYAQMTCLLQLATESPETPVYVIDPLAEGVWDQVHLLAPLFADPSIVKIGHSIGGLDVRSLHRDFGIFVVNAFDTYEASRILNLPAAGLADVCEYYGLANSLAYKSLKESYQACDWTARPLSLAQLHYARYDVHYLISLRELMVRDLTRDAWGSSASAIRSESQLVANALAETLKQYEDYEDDDGGDNNNNGPYEDAMGDDSWQDLKEDDADENNSAGIDNDEGSNASFETTQQFRLDASNGDDGGGSRYLTPMSSFGADDNKPSSSSQALSGDGEEADDEPVSQLNVATLRMQVPLMKVVSNSQERCLSMWKYNAEPHMQNAHLTSLIHRARRGEVDWTVSKTNLYNRLVEWRNRVADDLECLPTAVASLEFLLSLALKRPFTDDCLRKISFFLPPLFEEQSGYRQEVLSIIRQSFEEDEEDFSEKPTERATYFYSDFGLKTTARSRGSSDSEASDRDRAELYWQLCIVGALVAGAAVLYIAARRRRR